MSEVEPTASDYQESNVDYRLADKFGLKPSSDVGPLHGEGGDGGGGMDELRTRVAVLEVHAEAIRSDIRDMKPSVNDVRERLARLEVKVDHLPGKSYLAVVATIILGLVAALVAFQAQIQTYLGTLPSSPG